MSPADLMRSMAERLSARPWGRLLCTPLFRHLEVLEIVDEQGCVCGTAPRRRVHGNNRLLHRVVHVLVFDHRQRLLLQKRSMQKRVAPGRWDTSVGGHVDFGESPKTAMYREMKEELGIRPAQPQFAYKYIHANDFESEMVFTYVCSHNGPLWPNPEEIEQVRFWPLDEICACIGQEILSGNFEDEFRRYQKWASD